VSGKVLQKDFIPTTASNQMNLGELLRKHTTNDYILYFCPG